MLNDVYNRRILELAADIPRLGRLAAPMGSAKVHSKLCGSSVIVDVMIADGVVTDFAHDVKACALGAASSSLLARHVVGMRVEDLRALRARMVAMLKAGGPPPDGTLAEFGVLEPIRDFKARHASTLLTFDALEQAMDAALARSMG